MGVISSLREHGVLVFTGLGENYVNALQVVRKEAPNCVDDAMSVEMEDGSERDHFNSPLLTESGATLERLKRQRDGMGPEDCALEWMHACGCTMYDIMMTWHNGEPIAEVFASSSTECIMACRDTAGCDGWTFNPQNGWCALKAEDQILPVETSGFISGLMLGSPNSNFCCCPYCPNCSQMQSNIWPEAQCEV